MSRSVPKILHITDYASEYEGAFIRQLRMLNDELKGRGGANSALALMPLALSRNWVETLHAEGWETPQLPPSGTHATKPVVAAIINAIESTDPDVVHVHFGTYDLAAEAAVSQLKKRDTRWNNLKLVWHYRTALEESITERSFMRRLKDYLKFKRASRSVDLVVGVTNALADEAVARGVRPEAARGVVAGCDTDTFMPNEEARRQVRAQLGVSDDEVLLMHMGWHWHRKGGDLLAAALKELAADKQKVVGYSIGAPADVELGSVRALPFSSEVYKYHQAADIFISASRSEGFGNGLVEAMACSRVAVAACAEGQIETFAGLDGVIPVELEDHYALADGVRQLIKVRNQWSELGAKNRAHVVKNHSMRRWASEMADTYYELLSLPINKADKTVNDISSDAA